MKRKRNLSRVKQNTRAISGGRALGFTLDRLKISIEDGEKDKEDREEETD